MKIVSNDSRLILHPTKRDPALTFHLQSALHRRALVIIWKGKYMWVYLLYLTNIVCKGILNISDFFTDCGAYSLLCCAVIVISISKPVICCGVVCVWTTRSLTIQDEDQICLAACTNTATLKSRLQRRKIRSFDCSDALQWSCLYNKVNNMLPFLPRLSERTWMELFSGEGCRFQGNTQVDEGQIPPNHWPLLEVLDPANQGPSSPNPTELYLKTKLFF